MLIFHRKFRHLVITLQQCHKNALSCNFSNCQSQLVKEMPSTALRNKIIEKKDCYGGITVHSRDFANHTNEEFSEKIKVLIDSWRIARVPALWFHVLKEHSRFIPILVDNGFDFHHAIPGYTLMTQFMDITRESTLPRYPFMQIGVGGLCVDENGRILMMRELKGEYLGWKIPGGLLDPHETIFQAACREVREETNVDCEAVTILAFRHLVHAKYEIVGDIYFVVLLKLKEKGNRVPTACLREAADAKWISREEFGEDGLSSKPFLQMLLDQYDNYVNNGNRAMKVEEMTLGKRKSTMFFMDSFDTKASL